MRYRKAKTGVPFFEIIYNHIYCTPFFKPDILYIIRYTLFSVYIQKICKIPADILYIYPKKCIFICTYDSQILYRSGSLYNVTKSRQNCLLVDKCRQTTSRCSNGPGNWFRRVRHENPHSFEKIATKTVYYEKS